MAKPKITQVEQTSFNTESPLALKMDIPGLEFRWVDAEMRSARHDWKHWRAVERDSEVGQKVKDYMDGTPDKYQGPNNTSNYFHRGSQLILAWAKKEDCDAYRAAMKAKADRQLRSVAGDKHVTLTQTFVAPPIKGSK